MFTSLKQLLRHKTKTEKEIYQELLSLFTMNGTQQFVGDLLRRMATAKPHKIALIGKDKKLNYKEFYARAVQFSNTLRLNGVAPRDKVLLLIENSIEFYVSYFATWLIGAVVVPANTFLHEKEVAYIINDAKPKAIVVQSGFKKKVDSIVSKKLLNCLPLVLTENDIDWDEVVPDSVDEIAKNDVREFLLPDEMCLLLYTSGTTGLPKGVMLSSKNILSNVFQCCARLKRFTTHKERIFAVLPLFHVFAQNTCMWFPVLIGASVVVIPRIERRFIREGLKEKPTLFFGFPALYGLLCLMKNASLNSIKLFVSGADAMPDKIRAAFAMIYSRKICAGYGLTEASPVVAFNVVEDESPSHEVGCPLAEIECEIRDENEKSLKVGEVGNLWIRGDNIMLGYYNAKEETDKILKNGWLNTGDLSSFDKDGKLSVRGRSKDVIIRNGINIYPQEIENVLMSHTMVFKAAVVGREEVISGQVPIAFVAIKGKQENMEARLRNLCKNNLAAYKIPRKFVCLDDLPMSVTGKIDKKKLEIG
jgi:long-chain acyl-CoA synthetase